MDIRDARPEDAESIASIFNEAVLNTTAIWMDDVVDIADRQDWIAAREARGYPVLVATEGGRVLGYASFGDFRPYGGYRDTVENSIYVHPDARGKGVASALLDALIDRARALGKHVVVAGITANNEASIRLHERAGFRETARMPQVGQKFGDWLDLVFMQLMLDERPQP